MSRRTVLFLLLIPILFFSCRISSEDQDNVELIQMVEADQRDRSTDSDEPMVPKDDLRRARLFELLAQGKIVTPQDKYNAALILQHTGMVFIDGKLKSKSVENHYLAHQLALDAYDQGLEEARYFVAVTYDRYLWMEKGFQKYGTQTTYVNDQPVWVAIDSTTTDEERARFKVPPLAELLKKRPMQPR